MRDRSHAFSAGVDASGNPFANPVNSRHNYHNVFPSLQFRYDLGDNMLVRVAYSSTIARPGFNQSNPSLSVAHRPVSVRPAVLSPPTVKVV